VIAGLFCPRCSTEMQPLPLEPLFTMEEAALIVPCSPNSVRQLISRHKERMQPAIYRRHPSNPHLRVRYVYASDVAALRSILFSNELHPKKGRR